MAGKPIDYDLRIAEYEVMGRRRALTEEESAKLGELIRLQAKQVVAKRYRDSHKEAIKVRHAQRMAAADGARIREQRKEATKTYYLRNKGKVNANTRLWYARNPEASRTRNKSRTQPAGQIACGLCGQQFTASVAVMGQYKAGVAKYCGKVCSARVKVKTYQYDCKHCGKACVVSRNAGGSPPLWCGDQCRTTHRSLEGKRKRLEARLAKQEAKQQAKNGSSPPPPR